MIRLTEDEELMLQEKSYEYVLEDINKIEKNLYNINLDELHKFKWAWENGLFIQWDEMDDFVLMDEIFIDFKIDSDLTYGIKWCIFNSIRSQLKLLNSIGAYYETVKSNFKTIIENAMNTIGISVYPSLYNDYIDKDVFPRIKASYIIKKQWKESVSNPSYKVCKNRLKREFEDMIC